SAPRKLRKLKPFPIQWQRQKLHSKLVSRRRTLGQGETNYEFGFAGQASRRDRLDRGNRPRHRVHICGRRGACCRRARFHSSTRQKRGCPRHRLRFGNSGGVAHFIEQVPEADILVNNLGIFEVKPFLEIPDSDWVRFFAVNVLSGVRLTRHFLPGMLRKNWGRVIFISSESALQIPAEMIHYGVTKTAQVALARGLAESVAGTSVTVNSVLPGPTSSEGATSFVQDVARRQGVSIAEIERQFFATV